MNIQIRQASPLDIPFIYATWLKGLYYGNDWFREMDKEVFFANYHKVIETILQRSGVRVACLEDEPDVILGYSVVYAQFTLHWVFVKRSWRKMGIAKRLVEDANTCTHLTELGKKINNGRLKFDPFK